MIKIATELFLLLQSASVETCQSMWSDKENICYQEVNGVKSNNLEAVAEEQLQVEPRSIVQHPGVGEM